MSILFKFRRKKNIGLCYFQEEKVADILARDPRFKKFSEALFFAFGNETDISVSNIINDVCPNPERGCLLHKYSKFYNNVFLFVGL